MFSRISKSLKRKTRNLFTAKPPAAAAKPPAAAAKPPAAVTPVNTSETFFLMHTDLMKAGYVKNAVKYLLLVPENKRVNKHHQTLANAYITQGSYPEAQVELEKINTETLTDQGTRIFLRSQAQLKEHTGDINGAIHTYQMMQTLFRDKILEYGLEILKLHQKSGHTESFIGYAKLFMNSYPNHSFVIDIYATHLYDTNQLETLKLFLGYYLPRFCLSTKLCMLEAKCALIDHDLPRFDRAMVFLQRGKVYNRTTAEQVQRWRGYVESAEHTAQQMTAHCLETLETDKDGALINTAWTLSILGENDPAVHALDDYIEAGGQFLLAYMVRGLILHATGDTTRSLADLRYVIKHAPRQALAYRAILQMLFQNHPDMSAARELIAYRNTYNPQFTTTGEDGRLGFYDVEVGQSLWFEGRYLEGYRAKLNKATCRYIEQKFPKQYTSFQDYGLSGDDKRILILADDGISDEIRWASSYTDLPTDRTIVATCEPRLLSLFERSFPDISFTPVARRWPDLLQPAMPDRAGIDNVDFGRIITHSIFREIPTYDRLVFQQDLIAAQWQQQPGNAPSIMGPGTGAYLVPNPKLKKKWQRALDKRANGARLRVGLNWRSGLINPRRMKQYLSLFDLTDLLGIDDIQFYALQHGMSDEERGLCEQTGIVTLEEEIDWQYDFESIAAACSCMDLVLGISSSSFEVAAAVGVECWLAGISPEAVGLRLGDSTLEHDRISWNTRVIRPDMDKDQTDPDAPKTDDGVWPRQAALDKLRDELRAKMQSLRTA